MVTVSAFSPALRRPLVAAIFFLGGCGDGLTDINENPNGPTDVPAEFLLSTVIYTGVSPLNGALMFNHGAIWAQHLVQIQLPDSDLGIPRLSFSNYIWSWYFTDVLMETQTLLQKGKEEGHVNAEAVGRIWKSWVFHVVTDLWGDVPYSEALRLPRISTPAYDPQSAIYAGLISELEIGAALLSSGAQGFRDGDLIYSNDFTKWRKFANSLRMRLAMRMSEVDPATARSEFAKANDAGGFTSNDDNAFLHWPGGTYENPIYQNYTRSDRLGISNTLVDILKNLDDPRLSLYAEPAVSDGEFRGQENGTLDFPAGLSLDDFSRIGNFWRRDGAATPTAIMTYSEVLFLQAEAAARGWIAGDPATLYAEAIEANMNQYDAEGVGPSDSEIAAYLAQPAIAYTGLDDIHIQKWISLYMNGVEAWADQRRTEVPALYVGPDLMDHLGQIPVRFPYPESEQSLNRASLEAAVARQGGGLGLVTRVWWDVR